MTNELEYQETLEQIIPKSLYEYFLYDLQETYKSEFGWSINNLNKEEIDNDKIKVTLTLEKYKILETSYKTR